MLNHRRWDAIILLDSHQTVLDRRKNSRQKGEFPMDTDKAFFFPSSVFLRVFPFFFSGVAPTVSPGNAWLALQSIKK